MICPFKYKSWNAERYTYECDKYEAKHQCMIKNGIEIWKYEQYKKYIDYVSMKYGVNFISSFKTK